MSTHKNTFRHVSDDMKALIMQNRGGQQVIDRILQAYGFTSRQAFCNHIGISQSTMANRYARDTFPADWVVICSMETGVTVEWLAFGTDCINESVSHQHELNDEHETKKISNCDKMVRKENIRNEFNINPNKGGKAAIERLVQAYGFKTRQALADHLGVSKSTLANRYMRDTFPSDWIIKCALETGASLRWLSQSEGPMFMDAKSQITCLTKQNITNGKLFTNGYLMFDRTLLPNDSSKISIIEFENVIYLINSDFEEVNDGLWLVAIDGIYSIRNLIRLPNSRIALESKNNKIECKIDEINIIAKVIMTCK
ncbi:phage repressor protein CI [Escherichia coli]